MSKKANAFSLSPCMLACDPAISSSPCTFLSVEIHTPSLVGSSIPPQGLRSRTCRQMHYLYNTQYTAAFSLPLCSACSVPQSWTIGSCASLSKARVHDHRIPLGATEEILDVDVVGKALRRLAKEW